MSAQGLPLVEELERQIDSMLGRKREESPKRVVAERPLALTEENVRRVFGITLWQLFRMLAERFGYEVEEEPPKT